MIIGLSTILAKFAALGLVAQVGVVAGVTGVAVTTAAATNSLPGSVQNVVAKSVDAITPFQFPTQASPAANFGKKVATLAVANHGVIGKQISALAKQNGSAKAALHVPTSPGKSAIHRNVQTTTTATTTPNSTTTTPNSNSTNSHISTHSGNSSNYRDNSPSSTTPRSTSSPTSTSTSSQPTKYIPPTSNSNVPSGSTSNSNVPSQSVGNRASKR